MARLPTRDAAPRRRPGGRIDAVARNLKRCGIDAGTSDEPVFVATFTEPRVRDPGCGCGSTAKRCQVPRGAQESNDFVSTEQTTEGVPERERARTRGKVDAIFDLREAVERKVRVEIEAERTQSPDAKDELLDATLDVESKTQDAIDVCHDCDRPHTSDEPHERRARIGAMSDNVVEVQDDGRGFDSSQGPRRSDWRNGGDRGFGTSIMRAVMDDVEFKFGGTCVRLVKRLPAVEDRALERES